MLRDNAKTTTSDNDIVRRSCFLLDFDACRPSGISSSENEHQAALERAAECFDFLEDVGVSVDSMILADSGNGSHIVVSCNLPNDADTTALLKPV